MIPLCEPCISGNEWKYIKDCLDTNWVSSIGAYVDRFEESFAKAVGAKAAVVTMNGTAALTLALQTLGIGADDEVIVPSMTFSATVNPVLYVGAEPVFADITPDTWVMDASKIEGLITSRTKAVIPVHLYGNMVDMNALAALAAKHGLYIIEDATESLGASCLVNGEWIPAGAIGHFGAFSFNGNKVITTGAGGMLVSNDAALVAKAKYLSNQAKSIHANGGMFHEEIGCNYRMPNVLAAMGLAQLENLDNYNEKKQKQAALYLRELADTPLVLPYTADGVRHSQWMFCALARNEAERDGLIVFLKEKGIQSRPFFSCLHEMKPYAAYRAGDMAVSLDISARGINLPSTVGISEADIRMVCAAVCQFCNR